jgi:hypothetical protein
MSTNDLNQEGITFPEQCTHQTSYTLETARVSFLTAFSSYFILWISWSQESNYTKGLHKPGFNSRQGQETLLLSIPLTLNLGLTESTFKGYQGLSLKGWSIQSVKLTTQLHLEPWLWLNGIINSIHAFMTCIGTETVHWTIVETAEHYFTLQDISCTIAHFVCNYDGTDEEGIKCNFHHT